MSGTASNTKRTPRQRFKGLLTPLLGMLTAILAIVLGMFWSIYANLISLPQSWVEVLKQPFNWSFQNPLPALLILIILILVIFIIRLLIQRHVPADRETEDSFPSTIHIRLDPPPTPSQPSTLQESATGEIDQQYARLIEQKYLMLNLEGVPTPYQLPSVQLDDIFIDLEFLPRRLDSDYELSPEECERYLELEAKGEASEELVRMVLRAERNIALRRLKKEEHLSINDLWRLSDRQHSAVVIQGYPGMGKSTLLNRLALYFARLHLAQNDPQMRQQPELVGQEIPVPVLLLLKDYATKFKKALQTEQHLSVMEYLEQVTEKELVGSWHFLKTCLGQGRCLVMFDGLDEVSDLQVRQKMRDEIEHCIASYSAFPSGKTFNRFLITSRIAGYDLVAFRHYHHVTISELNQEQIEDFLPRWCRASIPPALLIGNNVYAARLKEAETTAQRVIARIKKQPGIRKLADNPLLLTLLAILQQNRFNLPQERYKIYEVITTTLLVERNKQKDLPYVPEKRAVELLGPIAYELQGTDNRYASKRMVEQMIFETIATEMNCRARQEILPEVKQEIQQEVERFLLSVRERSGLFVVRVGESLGFFHRTFQEYFTARYLLNQIKLDSNTWLPHMVELARRKDALWREPFLLAVAYQSAVDETLAQKILHMLLAPPEQADLEQRTHDVALAASCVLEAEPLALGREIEERILTEIIEIYTAAQRTQAFALCRDLEGALLRLLNHISAEDPHPSLLLRLGIVITQRDTQNHAQQLAALTLLALISPNLQQAPDIVFQKLIPLLLALCALPAAGQYQPAAHLAPATDYDTLDLVLTTLSFMGKRGPGGSLVGVVREYFTQHPEQLELLARISLECGTLITPVVIPQGEEAYRQYERTIGQWIELRDFCSAQHITTQHIVDCVELHMALLACTEEVKYPFTLHLLALLQYAQQRKSPWMGSWQEYFQHHLRNGKYIDYQELLLFWVLLFPSSTMLTLICDLVLKHYAGQQIPFQTYAQRFLANISGDLRDLRYLRYSRYLSGLSDLSDSRGLRYLIYSRHLSGLRYSIGLSDLSNLSELSGLRELLLTKQIVVQARQRLSLSAPVQDSQENNMWRDSLTILMGRLTQMQENQEIGPDCEQESREIITTALLYVGSQQTKEVQMTALDIVRALPLRTENEIVFAFKVAREAVESTIQNACVVAISRADPKDKRAWKKLEQEGKAIGIEKIQMAVQEVLGRRKTER